MKEIKLPCGETTVIDDSDAWIKDVFPSWRRVRGHVKIARYIKTEYGSAKEEYYLHRFIVRQSTTSAYAATIDHKNRNGLDNRRSNLRWASQLENSRNRSKNKKCSTKYIGVSFSPDKNKTNPYRAYIKVGRQQKHLGFFANLEDAARARDVAAKSHHGEFASLNFGEDIDARK